MCSGTSSLGEICPGLKGALSDSLCLCGSSVMLLITYHVSSADVEFDVYTLSPARIKAQTDLCGP